MYQGKYLELKWQTNLGWLFDNPALKFSKEGSRIAVYSSYDHKLVLLNSFDGSFVGGNRKILSSTYDYPSLRYTEVIYNSTSG